MQSNDLPFVRNVVAALADAGVEVWLFGGWAKELLGMIAARAHGDVDLLYPATNFDKVDEFLADDDAAIEIAAKHFPHKRAFLRHGIMIEIVLVQGDSKSGYYSTIWGSNRNDWPADLLDDQTQDLRIASANSLITYRRDYDRLQPRGR
jgi:hypothetical protein